MRKLLLPVIFLNSILNLQAQTMKQDGKLSDELSAFFVENWTGNGEFANGKKISADITFKFSLDSVWLISEHADQSPNRYKAFSIWGIDRSTGHFVAYIFDNSRGHRQFVSDGWKEGILILTTNQFYPQTGLQFQHFIYEKLTEKSFKMTYETSKDGIIWKSGDYLVFNKL